MATLKDADISIRRRGLDLLFTMCNNQNVRDIVDELLKYLEIADFSMRDELVLKTAVLAERSVQPSVCHMKRHTPHLAACLRMILCTLLSVISSSAVCDRLHLLHMLPLHTDLFLRFQTAQTPCHKGFQVSMLAFAAWTPIWCHQHWLSLLPIEELAISAMGLQADAMRPGMTARSLSAGSSQTWSGTQTS